MKTIFGSVIFLITLVFGVNTSGQNDSERSPTQTRSLDPQSSVATPAAAEAYFKELLTDADLSGRWAALQDGQLGEERTGDKYHIVEVTKAAGDNWIVRAKLKYRDQEFVLPIPVQVKFIGNTAIMLVDNLSIPGGSTYSARLLFHERTYSGTWSGARGGGMLYGVITHAAKTENASEEK